MSCSRAALLLGALLAACSRDWRTDMWYQPSLRPEDAPLPQPAGSVPLGAEPRYEGRDDMQELVNPVSPTREALAHGKALFLARCAPCHGKEGHGGGPVSRFFPAAPDLAYATVVQRRDGFIFGTITFGGRAMPPQREGLSERDRWELVHHVRAIQGRISPP